MHCAKCNKDNPADASFCEECGSKLELFCPACKASASPGARFCKKCGTAIGAPKADANPVVSSASLQIKVTESADGSPLIDGERKTVTALFADIKGSTELEQDLDPEEARAIVDPALKIMIDAVRHYEGYVVQSTGDGIFALFGAPIAREDHPQLALYAALRMQEELRRYSAKVVADGGIPIEARIGANTGEVVARSISTGGGHFEYTAIGHTTNLAARMQAVAPTGSIAISEATRKLVEGYFQLKPLGPTRVKGVGEPVNVYEVTGVGPLRTRLQRAAGRGLTKFVGRQREIDAMKAAAERSKAGHGQVVAAMAEPGVGKSRLFYEFKATSAAGWMVLEAFSVSHGKASAYVPVIDLLHGYFKMLAEDDTRTRREKINGRVLTLDRTLEDALPYLFGLLGLIEGDDPLAGMDAQLRRRRVLDAIKRIILRESLNQPLMVVFEDLHWIDEETQALLNLLVESIGNAKVLVLVNYRPEYSHQWNSKTYYTQLNLDPLAKESAQEMLDALLGDATELASLKRLVIERSEGTPFFMEEMVQALFEEGALVRNGGVHLTRSLDTLKVPPTVQAILASRIDRLPPDEKDLLQTLALVGREFSLSLAREVIRKPADELDRMLNDLQLAEFIYEQPAVGDVEYIFKHALTQQVAQDSMLTERRKAIHERVGSAIEALYERRIDEHLPELAHHYKQARNVEKAVHFLKRSAERDAERSALSEAETQLRDAIALLAALPASSDHDLLEFGLQTTLGALLVGKSFGASEREAPLRRAYELSSRVGSPQQVVALLFQLGQFYIQQLRLGEAREFAEMTVSLAGSVGEPIAEIAAWHNLGESYFWSGDLLSARPLLERAFELYESVPPQTLIRFFGFDWWIVTALFLAITDLILGRPEEAIHWEKRIANRARTSSHPLSKAAGLAMGVSSAAFRAGDYDLIRAFIAPARQLCDDYGFPEVLGWFEQFDGYARFWQGQREAGLSEMMSALGRLEAVGSLIQSTWRLAELARMHLELGNYLAADATVAKAFENMQRTGERWCEPEVHRIAGEVALRKPPGEAAAAERHLHTAIDISRKQSAKWWELRATMTLARLLAKTGRSDKARAMLAEIYNWFTEGFDTVDLKVAKALLAELLAG